jgi:CheY-like chemotaxis protein
MTPRILIIDDDLAVLVTVAHVLSIAGYKVATASNGKRALFLLNRFDPNLVLTDLIMPEMDGVETITEIKKTRPDLKIIAMSGGARIGNGNILQRAKEFGADLLISKPFEMAELTSLIGRSLAATKV